MRAGSVTGRLFSRIAHARPEVRRHPARLGPLSLSNVGNDNDARRVTRRIVNRVATQGGRRGCTRLCLCKSKTMGVIRVNRR